MVKTRKKGEWLGYTHNCTVPISQLTTFFNYIENTVDLISQRDVEVYNVPAAFDIETSSWYQEDFEGNAEKVSTMYIWQFGLDGSVIYGRTWEEFMYFCKNLAKYLGLGKKRKLIVYVHNLGYEFQFIRKWFNWVEVFSIKNRRPVKALTDIGIEFRCSLFLSNYALAYIGENLLTTYPVKKMVGDLDYDLIRHSQTPLTEKELGYCINDVKVVMSYIEEKIEHDGSILEIPLTNTGYVRNYCRQECFFEECVTEADRKRTLFNYRSIMKSLQIESEDQYKQLHRGFMGGFTHAGCLYSGRVIEGLIGSADLTSSYPFAMIAQYYPMSRGDFIGTVNDPDILKSLLNTYCCIFDIEFSQLAPKEEFENPLSLSRCVTSGRVITNNGRIVSADSVRTTLTELDYDTIQKFYTWKSMKVTNLWTYNRGYLPRALIVAILKLYEDKTSLKGVIGKETEYLVSKNMINAAFGMMVTAIVRDEYCYTDEWMKNGADVASQLSGYNKNFNRFLFYGWGVWVTAHARHNLFSAIYEFGEDYIYSDTDSIKGLNFDGHKTYFENYNNQVYIQLLKMCDHYNIDFKRCAPCTPKGEAKTIGLWDMEEGYIKFKTCGAKRYIYQYSDGFVNMTCSGVNKTKAMPYLIAKYNNIDFSSPEFSQLVAAYKGDRDARKAVCDANYDYTMVFEVFGEGMFIPPEHTGKMTLTYIDTPTGGICKDYLGNLCQFHELSSIHMEKQSYYMSVIGDYIKFLEGIQYVEI